MRRPLANRAVLSQPERAGNRRQQSGDRAGERCEIRRWRRRIALFSCTSDPRRDISPSLSVDRVRTRRVVESRKLLSRPFSAFCRFPYFFAPSFPGGSLRYYFIYLGKNTLGKTDKPSAGARFIVVYRCNQTN